MERILLTGATGFLGSFLLRRLINAGYEVTVAKRAASDLWRIEDVISQVRLYDVDLGPVETLFEGQGIECVVHLATFYQKFDSSADVDRMLHANVVFPAKLLQVGVQHGVTSFINTGTFFEYDCSVLPVSEKAAFKPQNFYAKSKVAFEAILKSYCSDISAATLKLFSPYGPKDNDKLIPMLLKSALTGKPISLSSGFQKMDFTYCEDIVEAYVAAIRYSLDAPPGYDVFNIGSGAPTSVREVVSIVESDLGLEMFKQWGRGTNDIPIAYADVLHARDVLGWSPEYSIQEGLKKTLEYYQGVVLSGHK